MLYEYQYAPLATPSTIRVIKIQEQKIRNKIACAIRHVEQAEFEYEALSYVWGEPKATRYVYLGNEADSKCLFPLHINLWRFLNWAWDRKMFDRWIWTDRISLDQEDHGEMAQQIPRMGNIFRNAKQVLAWLGMSPRDDEYMEYLKDHDPRHLRDNRNSQVKKTQSAAKRVQENEYWGRVWIAQEVCCAKRVVVLIGNVEVDLASVAWKASSMREKSFGSPVRELIGLRSRQGKSELWDILRWVTKSDFKCGRPQDRVYGVLGLVSRNSDGTSPVDHIDINYDKSTFEVMLDAVLVSEPPWDKFIQHLTDTPCGRLGIATGSIFDALKEYLGSHRVLKRNKELALYTFQACDALVMMFDVCKSRPGWFTYSAFARHLREIDWSGAKPTLEEFAVMRGISNVLGHKKEEESDPIFENWKACQEHEFPRRAEWRCAEHMHRERASPAVGEDYLEWFLKRNRHSRPRAEVYEPFFNGKHGFGDGSARPYYEEHGVREKVLDPQRSGKACSKSSDGKPCSGSTMMFEIPEVDFRLVFQLSEEDRSGHLFLHFRLTEPDEKEAEDGASEEIEEEEHDIEGNEAGEKRLPDEPVDHVHRLTRKAKRGKDNP